jgi:hypothetical protein
MAKQGTKQAKPASKRTQGTKPASARSTAAKALAAVLANVFGNVPVALLGTPTGHYVGLNAQGAKASGRATVQGVGYTGLVAQGGVPRSVGQYVRHASTGAIASITMYAATAHNVAWAYQRPHNGTVPTAPQGTGYPAAHVSWLHHGPPGAPTLTAEQLLAAEQGAALLAAQ